MKNFFRVLGQDLRRTILSWTFLISVVALAATDVITLFDEYRLASDDTSVLYLLGMMNYRNFHMVFLIFAALTGTTLFCSDWDNRFIRFSVVRSSKNVYASSKAIACFTSAVLSIFLAGWLTVIILSFKFPLMVPRNSDSSFGAYQELITPAGIYLYVSIVFLCKGFCAGFLSVVALWFSTKVTNVFVTIATPMLAYYLIQVFGFATKIIPPALSIDYLTKALVIVGGPVVSFLHTISIFSILAALFGWMFVRSCKRRIING